MLIEEFLSSQQFSMAAFGKRRENGARTVLSLGSAVDEATMPRTHARTHTRTHTRAFTHGRREKNEAGARAVAESLPDWISLPSLGEAATTARVSEPLR